MPLYRQCHTPEQANWRHAFDDLALAVVQAGATLGLLRIRAEADGLMAGEVTIRMG